MSSLGILDKEDMAELVESLISITHLNRRITMSEEGVGGPIDVAIISKGMVLFGKNVSTISNQS